MKSTRRVAAVLPLVALAAIGCSKRGETPQAQAVSRDVEPPKQVATRGELRSSKPGGEEGVVPGATPKITGPVSFADGQTAYQARKYGNAAATFERYTAQRPANAWGH